MEIEENKIEFRLDEYIRSQPETLTDSRIINLVDLYKHNFSQKLFSIHPDILAKFRDKTAKWEIGNQLYVSIKVDGEGMFFVYDNSATNYKSYFCNASKHRIYVGLPINQDMESIMEQKRIQKCIIPGEVYAAPLDNENNYIPDFSARSRVAELNHCLRSPDNQTDLDRVGFRIFDLIELNNDKWLEKSYHSRFSKLKGIFSDSGRVALVQTQRLDSTQLIDFYHQVVEVGGAEGIVIKNPENFRGNKVKPVRTVDAVILGAVCGRSGSRLSLDQIAVALTGLRYPDGSYQILGPVGGGLDDDLRKTIWDRLEFVESSFIGVTHDGRAFRMVKPVIVAQLEYLDAYSFDRNDNPNFKSSLNYDEAAKNWELIRPMPFVNLISPRFCSDNPIREDKEANIFDVRVDQINEFIDLDRIQNVQALDLPESEILRREIFINKKKVKKFIAWKTNKHNIDPSFPKLVISFTDYSPDRNNPLQRKIKVSNVEDQVEEMFSSWIDSEVISSTTGILKRGWRRFNETSDNSENPETPEIPETTDKQEKFIKALKQVGNLLSSLSKNLSLNFPSPSSSEIDHIILRLQDKNTDDFISIMAKFNRDDWKIFESQTDMPEKTLITLRKILNRFEKYSDKKYQKKVIQIFRE